MLTPDQPRTTIPQDTLKLGGVIVKGIIICNRCRKKMDGVCKCKSLMKSRKNRLKPNTKCLIQVYWKGKHYEYRRDDQGYVFTYDKAKDKLAEISTAIKKGTFNPVDYTDANIGERKFCYQIAKWLQEKEDLQRANELSWGTLRDYRGYVKNHYPILDGLDVREIGREQLTQLKDSLSHLSIKTRKNVMNALRSFFSWLKDRGTVKDIPAFPKIAGEDAKTRTAIDYDLQMETLLRIPENHRDVIQFLMETGLRPGEACALLVEHIDLRSRQARIERTFTGYRIRETTKQKRKRIIPLSERAYEIAAKHAEGKHPKQYLFINPNTQRNYAPDTLWRIWTQHSGLAITLYEATRHSFGSQLVEENDISLVKELMGHSDIQTTQKYLHMRMTKLRDVVNKRGKVIPIDRKEKEAK